MPTHNLPQPNANATYPLIQCNRGALKKKSNAHVHVQNPSKKHPPTSFFFRSVFLIAFSGVSQQVEFKNTEKLLGGGGAVAAEAATKADSAVT
jgi:hypothetical protein